MASSEEIFGYLPKSYKTADEENYIQFLWESFELNYENEKYQFAFIAYHLLFMTYVYFQLWKIHAAYSDDFRKSILGFNKIRELFEDLEARNDRNRADGNALEQFYPFSFSEENESTIMMFFHLIGCDKSKIGRYKKLIKDRNEIAHANGKMVFVASYDLDRKIDEIISLVAEIHEHSRQPVQNLFVNFLENSVYPESREYLDDFSQFNEVLIRGNYLSPRNIDDLKGYSIHSHLYESKYEEMEVFFQSFLTEFGDE